MGTNAWPAVPTLVGALTSANDAVAWSAGIALADMRADECPDWSRAAKALQGARRPARVFCQLLLNTQGAFGKRYDPVRGRFALIGLSATGPAVSSVYSDVINVVKSEEEPDFRALAVTAVAKAETERSRWMPLLKGVLRNREEWPQVSAAAAEALAAGAPQDPEARDLLRQALQDPRALVRLAAARALWKLGAPVDQVLPGLRALLSHKLATVRAGALLGLSEMGGAARECLPAIEELASDEHERVRHSALVAYRNLTGPPYPGSNPAHQTKQRIGVSQPADGRN